VSIRPYMDESVVVARQAIFDAGWDVMAYDHQAIAWSDQLTPAAV
jgi:hypothetical protein